MSSGQLGLLKQLTDSQGFSTEISADSGAVQFSNPEESNIETSSCHSSLEEEEAEEGKGYDNDDEDDDDSINGDDYSDEEKDDDDGDDDDDDDDESSYESETLDKTENTDDNLSSESLSSSQAGLERVTKNDVTSTSLGLRKDEEIDEIQEEQHPESSNKARKSVSFDGICRSKGMTSTEGSSTGTFPQVLMPDSLAAHNDVSLGRKKMIRQENVNIGADEENIVSVSVSTTSISEIGSSQTSNEPSSGYRQRNPSMRFQCQESPPVLDNFSPRLSAIKEKRQRQSGWSIPVSIDERLDQSYQELYQLMTRDVEVKGKERQLIHAFQMEQMYEKYLSVSHGFVRPTYVIPRSALSVQNDSSMKKAKKVKEWKDPKSPSKLNNQMSVPGSQKSRDSSNDQEIGNSSPARFVDHRFGQSTNPDILKWLSGKNQMFWKQKKEEKVQKKLEKETKKLDTMMKAERRLQSQQAVYNWMQQKLKETELSLLEDKGCRRRKSELKKPAEAHLCQDALAEDKKEEDNINGQQICSKKFSESQTKLKSNLKPLQGQIKTNKERKLFSTKSSHFKHMESTLNYDAWTRQTVNEGCVKASCDDSGGSIKSKKKIVKDQKGHCSALNSGYLRKEKENISLQENEIDLTATEERPSVQKKITRPKTAHGTRRVRHSTNSNFLDVSEHFDKDKRHSEEETQVGTLSSCSFNESASHEDFDLDRNSSGNGGIKSLVVMDDDKISDKGNSDSAKISCKEF